MKKRESSNWNIAITHILTSWFAFPFLTTISWYSILSIMNINSNLINYSTMSIFYILWMYFWTIYSTNYIKKSYIIKTENKGKILQLSEILFTLCWLWILYRASLDNSEYIIFTFITFFLSILIFSKTSRKHIKENNSEK